MKEAYLYSKLKNNKVRCDLCNHRCVIGNGEKGICCVRENRNGVLYSLVYRKLISENIDPIEKKPLFHFQPGSNSLSIATVGCNFKCFFCQNYQISQMPSDNGTIEGNDISPEEIADHAIKYNCSSISYTYTEPTIYFEYAYDTAKIARGKGLKNIFITNGFMTRECIEMISPYLDAANIDLKSFKDSIYLKLNAGKLEPILRTLKILNEEGVWLEITNLIVPGWTDDFDMIREMCDWLYENGFADNPLHFSRFQPLYKLTQLPPTPLSSLTKARKIALDAGIKYVYIGNVPGTEAENTFCPNCHKTLIKRRGYMVLSNHIKNGKCGYCNEPIAGVWE